MIVSQHIRPNWSPRDRPIAGGTEIEGRVYVQRHFHVSQLSSSAAWQVRGSGFVRANEIQCGFMLIGEANEMQMAKAVWQRVGNITKV